MGGQPTITEKPVQNAYVAPEDPIVDPTIITPPARTDARVESPPPDGVDKGGTKRKPGAKDDPRVTKEAPPKDPKLTAENAAFQRSKDYDSLLAKADAAYAKGDCAGAAKLYADAAKIYEDSPEVKDGGVAKADALEKAGATRFKAGDALEHAGRLDDAKAQLELAGDDYKSAANTLDVVMLGPQTENMNRVGGLRGHAIESYLLAGEPIVKGSVAGIPIEKGMPSRSTLAREGMQEHASGKMYARFAEALSKRGDHKQAAEYYERAEKQFALAHQKYTPFRLNTTTDEDSPFLMRDRTHAMVRAETERRLAAGGASTAAGFKADFEAMATLLETQARKIAATNPKLAEALLKQAETMRGKRDNGEYDRDAAQGNIGTYDMAVILLDQAGYDAKGLREKATSYKLANRDGATSRFTTDTPPALSEPTAALGSVAALRVSMRADGKFGDIDLKELSTYAQFALEDEWKRVEADPKLSAGEKAAYALAYADEAEAMFRLTQDPTWKKRAEAMQQQAARLYRTMVNDKSIDDKAVKAYADAAIDLFAKGHTFEDVKAVRIEAGKALVARAGKLDANDGPLLDEAAALFEAAGDKKEAKAAYAKAAKAYALAAKGDKAAQNWVASARSSAHAGDTDAAEAAAIKAATAYDTLAKGATTDEAKAEFYKSAAEQHSNAGHTKDAKRAWLDSAAKFEAAAKTEDVNAIDSDNRSSKAKLLGEAADAYELAGNTTKATELRAESTKLQREQTKSVFAKVAPPTIEMNADGSIDPAALGKFEHTLCEQHEPRFESHDAAAAYFRAKAKDATDPAVSAYFFQAAARQDAQQIMADAGVKNVSTPPTLDELKTFAKNRAEELRKDGASEAEVAATVGHELSSIADAYYVHHGSVGEGIDYDPSKKNHNGIASDGRALIDCEGFAYDLGQAMGAAGFTVTTVVRNDEATGKGHVLLSIRSRSDVEVGVFSNSLFTPSNGDSSAVDKGFESVGLGPQKKTTTESFSLDDNPWLHPGDKKPRGKIS